MRKKMSKSIYDEALDILVDSFTDPQDEDDDCYMFNRSQMNKISKSLRKAQKQEKLLELHIDLANTIEVLYNAYGYGIFEFGEIKYICNKIKKELENV